MAFREYTDLDWQAMRAAVVAARESVAEKEKVPPPPIVGAVVAKDGQILGTAHRGEFIPGDHAEYCLYRKLGDVDLQGATLYTTLEPCSRRGTHKPCATWTVERGVAAVFIASYDPCPTIFRQGWRTLRDAGIECYEARPNRAAAPAREGQKS